MKRFFSVSVGLLLLFNLAISAFATGLTVTFTADSLPEAGGTLTVDKNALLDNGSITAEMYNALLEGNVIYSWYKNGTLTQEGTGTDANVYQVTLSDQGCTIYVKVSFYEDDSFLESKKCGEAVSSDVVVSTAATEPQQTTSVTTPATTQETTVNTDTETTLAETQPQKQTTVIPEEKTGLPWWAFAAVGIAAMATGAGVTVLILRRKN